MKLSDMTDNLFDREMARLLGDVHFWCTRLGQIGEFSLKPMPVEDGHPFPLAAELKQVWNYARGTGLMPEEKEEIIQDIAELLWSRIGGTFYDIPADWWEEPLGFMVRAANAREDMQAGRYLTTDQLAILSELTLRRIGQIISIGALEATKDAEGNWSIPAEAAKIFLKRRERTQQV